MTQTTQPTGAQALMPAYASPAFIYEPWRGALQSNVTLTPEGGEMATTSVTGGTALQVNSNYSAANLMYAPGAPIGTNFTLIVVGYRLQTPPADKVAEIITQGNATSGWEFNLGNGYGPSGDRGKARVGPTGSGGGTFAVWKDGVAQSGTNPVDDTQANNSVSTYVIKGTGTTVNGNLRLWNNYQQLAGTTIDGGGLFFYAINSLLDDATCLSLSSNPWQVYDDGTGSASSQPPRRAFPLSILMH